ncbi:MAG: hypothetical protein ACK4FB_14120 [Brevundimonas sp.]|uniref:hypothetical protein n=1 Tax=Brevundimonas sp. TaxID=1871086 RepID=UPI00391C1E90
MTPDTGHRMRSPETWDAARQAYMEGGGARDICDRYDLTLSAFRARARREGWRRADMADPEPPELDDVDDDHSPRPSFEDMAEMAARRAARALRQGRAGETQRWMAVHDRLIRQSRAEERAELVAKAVEDLGDTRRIRAIGDAARQIHREAVESTRELHQLHQLHRASSEPTPPDPDSPAPPLSRAERRRLDKLRRKR